MDEQPNTNEAADGRSDLTAVLERLLPCPFCGRKVDDDLVDTLYPTGRGWIVEGGHRHYVSYREAPKEQWCWQMLCPEVSGGCGAEIHGDTKTEAVAKWNRRASNSN